MVNQAKKQDQKQVVEGDGESQSSAGSWSDRFLFVGSKRALVGGLLTGVIAVGAQFVIGLVYSDTQALQLLDTLIEAARSLTMGIVTASATILALMLTILSISSTADHQLQSSFYKRVRNIARFNTVALVASTLMLLLFNFPIEEGQSLPPDWFRIVYYVLVAALAGITGLFVGTVLMLFETVEGIINIYQPGRESTLVRTQQEKLDPSD